MMPTLIGIAGGTGSGKTTVAREVAAALPPDSCAMVEHDSYYRDLSHLPFEERARQNFDVPAALENELLHRHLQMLREGQAIDCPVYDFRHHVRAAGVRRVEPRSVIVVEGILTLADPQLRACFDLRVFVDTADDIRLLRRIRRDVEERGRELADIREQYLSTVRPAHETWVAPSRQHAHIILPEGGENQVGIRVVVDAMRRLVDATRRPEKVSGSGLG
jgi:uridine kinase